MSGFKKIAVPILVIFLIGTCIQASQATRPKKEYYQIRIYKMKSNEQLKSVDSFLKDAFLPALHRAGINKVGVFKPISNDTATLKSIYVLIPFNSERYVLLLDKRLMKDHIYLRDSKNFREALSSDPPYDRMESVILEAFEQQKNMIVPVKNPETIFEWRSYESPTESLHEKKVDMFEKEEVTLFKKLNFNVVFYAKVISGNRMPNFVYMPSFSSIDDRNAHWKTFGADPDWKTMQAKPEYENKVSVSRIESVLLRATDYSDL